MHLLEVNALTLHRRRLTRGWWHRRVESTLLLEDLDFKVERRQCHALVGNSREALLYLALALAGERAVTAGEIVIAGVPLEISDPRRLRRIRRKVRFVFPDACGQLPPDWTVREIFREVMPDRWAEDGIDPVETVMVACALPEAVQDLFPLELDAVERQAVALARALLGGPDLLVVCGLTEGMDAVQRMELILRLRRVREEFRLAVLVLCDDLAMAAALADTVDILHHGRVVESGRTTDLLERPGHDYTQRLVANAA